MEKKLENIFDINIDKYNGKLYDRLKYLYNNYKNLIIDYCYLDCLKLDISDNYTRNNRLFWTIREELNNTIDILYYELKKDDILKIRSEDELEYELLEYYYNLLDY